MSLGHINLLAHEIEKAHGIELNHVARGHIERLMMAAIQSENKYLEKDKSYWMNKYLKREHPDKSY